MRNISVFVCLAVCLAMSFAAQGQSSRFSVGPSVSVDHYRAGSNEIEWQQYSKRTKYSLGVNAYYKLSKRFVLKSGLMYSRKGSKQTLDPERAGNQYFITYREVEFRANHIDLPLLVGYKLAQAGKWSLVPAAGVIVTSKLSETINITHLDRSTETITLNPSFSKIELGLTFEAGINHQASENLQIGISPYYRAMAYESSYYGACLDVRFGF